LYFLYIEIEGREGKGTAFESLSLAQLCRSLVLEMETANSFGV
jgi:hypothetical protein